MTEKKETVKKTATTKAAGEKKAAPRRSAAKKVVFEITAESVGTEEETLLGMGWLFKEGKIKAEENKITLA